MAPILLPAALALPLSLLLGCANPGLPKPPSLRLPEPATALHAERLGPEVRLNWTIPRNTTDGVANRGGMRAHVCRIAAPAGVCIQFADLPEGPGPAEATDRLPASLASGPPRLLAYRIELVNDRGKSARPSDPVYAAGGAAPADAEAVRAEPRRNGVVLTWQARPDSAGTMRVLRTQVEGTTARSAKGSTLPGSAKDSSEILLTAPADGPGDAGGIRDGSVRDGSTYTYVVQRVASEQIGGRTLELRGLPSPPMTVTYRDSFPPAPPGALVSIPGGGYGSPVAIDLSWDASPESNVIGYNVYRSTGGAFLRLNGEPLSSPSYRDLTVAAGGSYTYRVTALGRHEAESVPSADTREKLPQ